MQNSDFLCRVFLTFGIENLELEAVFSSIHDHSSFSLIFPCLFVAHDFKTIFQTKQDARSDDFKILEKVEEEIPERSMNYVGQ